MIPNSLLSDVPIPESFECAVRARMTLPVATVELHDYRFRKPQQAVFRKPRGFLDLALSGRPGEPRGYFVDRSNDTPHPIGDVMFVPGGLGLSSEWGAGEQSSICCEFEDTRSDEHARIGWSPDELEASLNIRSVFIRESLARLAREIAFPGFCGALLAEALCTQIGIELGRYFIAARDGREEAAGRLSSRQLRRIEELIEQPGRTPAIADLAAECGLSTRHFFRIFRATTGMTLSAFAAGRRIARAKRLLAAGRVQVKEIAYQCGFETPAAFSAAFRRATGMTAREFRQMARE